MVGVNAGNMTLREGTDGIGCPVSVGLQISGAWAYGRFRTAPLRGIGLALAWRMALLASFVLALPGVTAPADSPYRPVLTRYGPALDAANPWAPPARHEQLRRPFTWYDMGLNGASPGRQLADL